MRIRGAIGVAGLALALATPAAARPPAVEDGDDEVVMTVSLLGRLGVEPARALLVAAAQSDRLRGVERLGRLGDRRAVAILAEALEGGGPVMQDSRLRLAAARALAPHALDDDGRRALDAILGYRETGEELDALGVLAQATAARALARAGSGRIARPPTGGESEEVARTTPEERALGPVLAAAIGGGPAHAAAVSALASNPPADLGVFLRGLRTATIGELRLLGGFGDLRAIPMLRRALERSPDGEGPEVAVALAKLGDHTALAPMRRWLGDPKATPMARIAGVEVALRLGAPEGLRGLVDLLADPRTRPDALALAAEWPSPGLVSSLDAVVASSSAPASERRAAIAVLGAIETSPAAAALGAHLADPTVAADALSALTVARGEGPPAVLAKRLAAAVGKERRDLLVALVVRARRSGELPAGLVAALARAAAATDEAERAVGTFGSILVGASSLERALASSDGAVRAAAVSAAASLGPAAREALAPLARRALARKAASAGPVDDPPSAAAHARREAEATEDVALALGLLFGADLGSGTELAALAESTGPASLAAAYRLAARDPESLRPRLAGLLAATDPWVRAHVALGLGVSPEPTALARLEAAYAFEAEPLVRRAIVRALGLRGELGTRRTLELAQALDPDDDVRALAAAGLRGERRPPPLGLGGEPSRLVLVAADERRPIDRRGRAVLHLLPSGLAVPTVSTPDGTALLLRVERGATVHRVVVAR